MAIQIYSTMKLSCLFDKEWSCLVHSKISLNHSIPAEELPYKFTQPAYVYQKRRKNVQKFVPTSKRSRPISSPHQDPSHQRERGSLAKQIGLHPALRTRKTMSELQLHVFNDTRHRREPSVQRGGVSKKTPRKLQFKKDRHLRHIAPAEKTHFIEKSMAGDNR